MTRLARRALAAIAGALALLAVIFTVAFSPNNLPDRDY